MINVLLQLNIIMVDIKGEVKSPGVYKLESGNINDVIELAGGLTKDADTSFINLSKGIVDEMVIYIPNQSEKQLLTCSCPPPQEIKCPIQTTTTKVITTTQPTITSSTTTTSSPEKININIASLQELVTLNGIGQAIANKIIAFREVTPFVVIEDLMLVSGIGEAVFAQIKDFITV